MEVRFGSVTRYLTPQNPADPTFVNVPGDRVSYKNYGDPYFNKFFPLFRDTLSLTSKMSELAALIPQEPRGLCGPATSTEIRTGVTEFVNTVHTNLKAFLEKHAINPWVE